MAGHEWDWFQREELIGQISDIRVQNLQVERENVQKRTFTRWMNLHLDKCHPPLEVKDLFVDIQDGRILMALLEVLTGQSLLNEYKPSAHRIFRLNNIAKALKFLEDSNVKLVSIDAAEIADGNPSLVLGLIWNIILFLQIKELTGNLNRMSSSSSLSSLPSGTESETSQPSTPSTEKSMSVSIKDQRKAIKALLNWVQQRTRKYGVAVQDFGSSWKSGLAFLALIKSIDSSLVDIKKALERAPRENLQDAFSIAHRNLRIPRLLEPEDLMVHSPDEQSVMTYVTQFLEHFPELDADDFAEQKEDIPLEMTYVHYKDGPIEEEGKIINVTNVDEKENGHHKNIFVMSPPRRQIDIPRYSPLKENVNTEPVETSAPNNQLQTLEYKLDTKSGQAKNQNILDSEEIPPHKSDISGKDIWTALNNSSKSTDDLNVTHSGYTKDHFILPNGRGPVNGSDSPDEHPSSSVLTDPQKQVIKNNQNSYTLDYFHSDKSPVSVFQEDNAKHIQTQDQKTVDDGLATKITASDKTEPLLLSSSADSFKYVTHLPKNDSDGENSRRLTVFQVYKSGSTKAEDTPDHGSGPNPPERSLPFTEVEETSSTDSSEELKVSVIPHDLFYYPHYSVAISDVLHAFAEPYPSDSKRKGESTFSPERQEDECESHNRGRLSHKKCEIPALGPREPSNAPEVKLTERHARTSEVNLETSISPLKLLLKTSAPRESYSNKQNSDVTHSLDDADGVESPGSSEEAWVLLDKYTTYLPDFPQQRFDVEEKLEVIQDRAVMSDTNFKEDNDNDLWFSRSSHEDSSFPVGKEQNIPDKMIPEAFDDMEERSKGNHTESRKRKVGNARPVEKVEGGTEELSPSFHCRENVYYIILLISVIFYCILILPELDMSKVTFFSSNGV